MKPSPGFKGEIIVLLISAVTASLVSGYAGFYNYFPGLGAFFPFIFFIGIFLLVYFLLSWALFR
jgi:hypothetical protein